MSVSALSSKDENLFGGSFLFMPKLHITLSQSSTHPHTNDPTPPSAARSVVPDELEGLSGADREEAKEFIRLMKRRAELRYKNELATEIKPKLT